MTWTMHTVTAKYTYNIQLTRMHSNDTQASD